MNRKTEVRGGLPESFCPLCWAEEGSQLQMLEGAVQQEGLGRALPRQEGKSLNRTLGAGN